ncbi:MAG: FKBP-type peptidyl-prolyl cis-trans isomerase [Gemmataceae bacterium]
MLEKFWPLIVLVIVGVITLALLIPTGGGGSKSAESGVGLKVGEKQALPGGLEIEGLAEGDGEFVRKGDTAEVHYTGTLKADGSMFDSSFTRGAPLTVKLGAGDVIRGWDEGLPGMRVGDKRKLTIPAAMGYGARSPSAKIPPNSDLVFEVQLVRKVR